MILEKIKSPADVKKLSLKDKKALAEEIRQRLINVVLKNGGHLASNLGVTELTIALYSVIDPFYDKVIWDVGHQSYVHKLLTGRNEEFETLRQFGGISGFPKKSESDADCFETGHSSTSISAAVGMARARDIKGEKYKVVSVIGDGAFTNGMVYEALNDAGRMTGGIVIILNDNGMSISTNVGGMSKYFGKIRTGKSYISIKKTVKKGISKIPFIGLFLIRKIKKLKAAFRILTVPGEWFEEMGVKYIGPVDGHNISEIQKALEKAFYMNEPVVVHVITHKGLGYQDAEEDPSRFHGISPKESDNCAMTSYSSVLAEELSEMAEKDKRIIAITAAMPSGTGLEKFGERFPSRFFDVGIAEEHAITMAAGMAASGMKPYIAIYSTFMQRAYDQLLHDCALQKHKVVIALDRAGISGRDGKTHHGIYDLSYLNSIPGITVCAPCCANELREMIKISAEENVEGPFVIRYPAKDFICNYMEEHAVVYGRGAIAFSPYKYINDIRPDILIISIGQITKNCIEAAKILMDEGLYNVTVFHGRFLKPLDEEGILHIIEKIKPEAVFTAEDGIECGGFGSNVAVLLKKYNIDIKFDIIAVPQYPIEHGSIKELQERTKTDAAGIAQRITETMRYEDADCEKENTL